MTSAIALLSLFCIVNVGLDFDCYCYAALNDNLFTRKMTEIQQFALLWNVYGNCDVKMCSELKYFKDQ